MLPLIIIAVIIIVGLGVAARLALPSLRQYRAIQNDKRTAQLERELHVGDYAALAPPTSFYEQQPRPAPKQRAPDPRPQWVVKVNQASTYISTAGASAANTPPKPKVLHIEDIPDVPAAPKEKTKTLYQQWLDEQQ